MSRTTVTEEQRMAWDEASEWPHSYDCITVRGKRVYLKLASGQNHHHQEIDITHVYMFFKEMFTTDWKEEG